MKSIFLDEARPGMTVTRPVMSRTGNVLVEEGTVLTQGLIDRMVSWGIEMVQVEINREEPVQQISSSEETPDDSVDFPMEELMPESMGIDTGSTTPLPLKLAIEDIDKAVSSRLVGAGIKKRQPRRFEKFVYDYQRVQKSKKIVAQIHRATQKSTASVMANLSNYKKVDRETVKGIIEKLLNAAVENKDILTNLTSVKNYDNYLLAHSINVCILSIVLGYSMGMTRNELFELGEAALLHDIGMAKVPWHIWNKKGTLSDDEFLQVQKHTLHGADILLSVKGISPQAQVVAYQHHERMDGSGYPKGVKDHRIHEYSRIVAVVDVFEAMTSPRKYREKIFGNKALSYILTRIKTKFDEDVVRAFVRHLSLFPIGSLLRLNTGEVALVVSSNPDHPLRPTVKVIKDGEGNLIKEQKIINMLEEKQVMVNEFLRQEDEDINVFKAL